MKKVVFLTALIAVSFPGFAQKQWVGVSLQGFSSTTESETSNNGSQTLDASTIMLFPTISYNRFIGKDWGLGLELGYRSFKYSQDDYYRTPIDVRNSSSEHSETALRISPSLFQNFSWKKYRGLASLSIPIDLRQDIVDEGYNNVTNPTGQIIGETDQTITRPNQLSVGAMVNLSVQRQLVGGLYFGPQLGFGIMRSSSNGTTTNKSVSGPVAGPKTETVDALDERQVQAYFSFFPSLNLCYYF